MQLRRNEKIIGLDAILLAIYFAITPIHQTLLLPTGGTVNKYLAFVVMIAIVLVSLIATKNFVIDNRLFNSLIMIVLWFAFGLLYSASRSATMSGLISIVSYLALMIIVSSKEWTNYEKNLFKLALIAACVFYSVTLIESVATVKRATFILGDEDTGIEADPNILAINIGIGFMFALSYFLDFKKVLFKVIMLAAAILILTGVVCTGSRGALIAIIAATLYYLFSYGHKSRRSKIWIIFLTIVIFVAIIVLLSTNVLDNEELTSRYSTDYRGDFFSGRLQIWGKYFDLLIHRVSGFIIGYGYNAGSAAYTSYFGNNYPPATHNDVIQLICCGGIVALLLFYKLIKLVWNKATINRDVLGKALMILVLVGGLSVDSFQRYGWWNAMIFAYIGIGVLIKNEK